MYHNDLATEERREDTFELEHTWGFWDVHWEQQDQDGGEKAKVGVNDLLGEFGTIQDFWSFFNHLHFREIKADHALCMFKKGIQPTWEDPANLKGAHWKIYFADSTTNEDMLPRAWMELAMALVGEQYPEGQVTGIGAHMKSPASRSYISLWVKSSEDSVLKTGTKHWAQRVVDPLESRGALAFEFIRHRVRLSQEKKQKAPEAGKGAEKAPEKAPEEAPSKALSPPQSPSPPPSSSSPTPPAAPAGLPANLLTPLSEEQQQQLQIKRIQQGHDPPGSYMGGELEQRASSGRGRGRGRGHHRTQTQPVFSQSQPRFSASQPPSANLSTHQPYHQQPLPQQPQPQPQQQPQQQGPSSSQPLRPPLQHQPTRSPNQAPPLHQQSQLQQRPHMHPPAPAPRGRGRHNRTQSESAVFQHIPSQPLFRSSHVPSNPNPNRGGGAPPAGQPPPQQQQQQQQDPPPHQHQPYQQAPPMSHNPYQQPPLQQPQPQQPPQHRPQQQQQGPQGPGPQQAPPRQHPPLPGPHPQQ